MFKLPTYIFVAVWCFSTSAYAGRFCFNSFERNRGDGLERAKILAMIEGEYQAVIDNELAREYLDGNITLNSLFSQEEVTERIGIFRKQYARNRTLDTYVGDLEKRVKRWTDDHGNVIIERSDSTIKYKNRSRLDGPRRIETHVVIFNLNKQIVATLVFGYLGSSEIASEYSNGRPYIQEIRNFGPRGTPVPMEAPRQDKRRLTISRKQQRELKAQGFVPDFDRRVQSPESYISSPPFVLTSMETYRAPTPADLKLDSPTHQTRLKKRVEMVEGGRNIYFYKNDKLRQLDEVRRGVTTRTVYDADGSVRKVQLLEGSQRPGRGNGRGRVDRRQQILNDIHANEIDG